MEPRVTPAECALAIALPLTFDEFARDAASPDKDFVKRLVDGSGRTLRAAWDELYRPKVVALCAKVAERARGLGATVVTHATAASLADLLARFPVVSLFAHSIAPAIRPADVVRPRAILEILDEGEEIVARELRAELADQAWARDEEALRRQLAALLDELLQRTSAWYGSTVRADRRGRPALTLNRVMLEDCFGAALRRGPALELCDGLKTMDELLRAIPPEFSGVLDLSVCNSVAIGESIKRRRPRCLVVENQFLARVDLRLARYALVLDRLDRQPALYTDALAEIHKALIAS